MWCVLEEERRGATGSPEAWPRDPKDAALRLRSRDGLAWLDGDGRGELGRWSFVTADPVEVRSVAFGDHDCLSVLPTDTQADATEGLHGPPAAVVPLWIGFLGYDAALPCAVGWNPGKARISGRPVAIFKRYSAVYAYDHHEGRAYVCGDDEPACRALIHALSAPPTSAGALSIGAAEGEDPAIHRSSIEAALEHIARGDIYQVNLARRWMAPFEGDPLGLFLAMRRASRVPFGFYLHDDRLTVLGRSMERFLRWDRASRTLESRPIKGTRARDGSDEAVAAELRADPKESAEHAMIVDLVRNDLGRVAEVGSVEVRRLFDAVPFARLVHLISTVRCRTRAEVTLIDAISATFPPGSVTGTPKIRAMEVIEALEPSPRGVYCGAYGFIDRAGGASLAVAIRTAVVADRTVQYHAGGGLVEASVADREIAETELKARVFFDALAELAR